MALYRADRYEEALRVLEEKVINPRTRPLRASLILAMLHQKLGRADEARKWLDTAADVFRESDSGTTPGVPRLSWVQRLEAQMLRGEAEALIVWGPDLPG